MGYAALSLSTPNTDNRFMSLILEALKKSETERRLGETPSLSTVPQWKPKPRLSRAWLLLVPILAIAMAAGWNNRDLLGDGKVAQEDVAMPSKPTAPRSAEPTEAGMSGSAAAAAQPAVPVPATPPTARTLAQNKLPTQPMPEPAPLPQSIDDLEAMKGISPENQRRIRSGELFVPSPSLLAERGPTQGAPIVTAQSALPALLPEPTEVPSEFAPPASAIAAAIDSSAAPMSAAAPAPGIDAGTAVAPATVAASTLSAPAESSQGTVTIHDLTLGQRQGLPPLKMSVHLYHRDVARRFVVIDGKRLNEDGVLGNDVWVREIVPEGVIIEYKSIRFLLPRLGG
jgi:general secretion pathway protein B